MTREISLKNLGNKIKTARKVKGISQEKLAEIVDIGATHVSNIENNKKEPSLKVFVKIAEALNVTPNELLSDSLEVLRPVLLKETEEFFEGCSAKEITEYKTVLKALKETRQKE